MNLTDARLMHAPTAAPQPYCSVCGASYTTTMHHVVPKARGGHKGPVLPLCGHGTAGCHGKAEDKMLHFDYRDGWVWFETPYPTKREKLPEAGWHPLALREEP